MISREQLAKSEVRYRTVVEKVCEGIAIVDAESCRIIFANPALAAILGMDEASQLQGGNFLDCLSESECQRAMRDLQDVRLGMESPHQMYNARNRAGDSIRLEVISSHIACEGRPACLLLISDVTERLRGYERNTYQARLLRDVNDAIIATDMDFHITSWNQAAERLYGWQAQEALGRDVKEIVPVKVEGLSRDELRLEILKHGSWRGQALHYCRDGKELIIDWSLSLIRDATGQTIGVVAINRDVTDRKRAEQALAEAHGRLLTILDSLDAVVHVADMETHEILFANRFAQEIFGNDLVGSACWQALHVDQKGPCDFCDNPFLIDSNGESTGASRWEHQNRVRGDWWDIQARAIRWVDGRKVRLEIATDITSRKKMEMELQAREQLYHSIFENTGTATVIIEEDTTISAANAECEALFGHTREEIEGRMRWTQFVVAEDLDKMMDFHRLRRSATGGVPSEYEFRIRDKMGQEKDILGKVCMIPGTMRSIASLIDITPLKRAGRNLRASEQRLRRHNEVLVELAKSKAVSLGELNSALEQIIEAAARTLEVMRVSVWLYDSDQTAIRSILWYSTGSGVQIGTMELQARDFPAYLNALQKDRVIAAPDAWNDPRTAEFAEEYLKPHGITSMLIAPVWLGGQIVGVLCHEHTGTKRQWSHEEQQFAGSMADFVSLALEGSERRWARQALRKSEERYRELADLLPQPVFEMAADGTVSFANRSALDTFGYTQEDLVTGFQVLQLVDPKDRERAERALKQKLESNDRDGPAEYNFVRKDGSTLPVVAYVSPIIQDGKAVGLRGLLLDITDRKKSETELLNIQRLESIAVLAGGIAHDFNNLLTVIMGNVSMAQMYVQPGEPGYRVLAEAEKASLRAKDLSYKLLTFSKGGVPVKRATALQNSIRDTVSLALSGGNVKAECDIADDLCLVDCDPTQISQVINSLVINAREAMPEGGAIEIKARNVVPGQDAALPLKNAKYIKLVIKDFGVGIADHYISRIFDPYFTTKPRGPEKGSGLGLSIVYSIVRRHDGLIVVESKVGEGSTFIVYLPASVAKTVEGQSAKAVSTPHRDRILVMDDEDSVRDVIATQLAHLGYEAVLVKNGAEALAAYQVALENGQPFAVVIMDLTIPGGMGGQETMRHLLAVDPKTKAILSSGYSNDPIMQNFTAYGFRGVVAKPYRIQQVREVLQSVLKQKA